MKAKEKKITQIKTVVLAILIAANLGAIAFMAVRINGATGPTGQGGGPASSFVAAQLQGEGTYAVGTDIPQGEYLVRANTEFAYVQLATSEDGELENILASYDFTTQVYITVQEGQYLQVRGSEFALASGVEAHAPADGLYTEGMFLVGKDLPAGDYIVQADPEALLCFVEVAENSSGSAESIMIHQEMEPGQKASLTVWEGQYLLITGCSVKATA